MRRKLLVDETIREDGLRVISKTLRGTKKVHLEVNAGVGSAYDPPDKNGLFHFFEHMAFKGTSRHSQDDIRATLGQYSLVSNASTGRLNTAYWAQCVHTRTKQILDLLFDIYQDPIFPEDEFVKEKEVVKNEIVRNEDDDSVAISRALLEALYEKSPLRKSGVGTFEGVEDITREGLFRMHRRWYIPSNTTIIATGKTEHEWLCHEAFSAFPFEARLAPHTVWGDESLNLPQEKEIVITRPNRKRGFVLLGCKTPRLTDEEFVHLQILLRVLAMGSDSLLFQGIREDRGLVYTVAGGYGGDERLGKYLVFRAEALPERIPAVRNLMNDIITSYSLDDESRFVRAKERVLDSWVSQLETFTDWYNVIRLSMIEEGGNAVWCTRAIKKSEGLIRRTTLEDIILLWKRLVVPERLVSVILKPE